MTLHITYLYPHHMNLYGDTGNIICLSQRAHWRGIDVKIKMLNPGESLRHGQTDLYFFGGGQDAQQVFVAQDLLRHQSTIQDDLSEGVVALTICGGYQLFGHRFVTKTAETIPGIGIFDLETHGSDHRMIGDIVVSIEPTLATQITKHYPEAPATLVGFENHSGETNLNTQVGQIPLGKTLAGFGNNYTSQHEGTWRYNAFGSYMHGSLLPKNPHFADYLIALALSRKHSKHIELSALNDEFALKAHRYILQKNNLFS